MKERYENLNGLRVFSCIAIIAMHIKANSEYQIEDWFFQNVIGAWGQLVALFIMISGFGMFCGYYDDFRNGKINLVEFYSKRYMKILPFFLTLIIIDVILDRSLGHVLEGLTEATLVFGLLPNNQPDVIGVCWTLGVIFLFYMLFPFITYLCRNRKLALYTFFGSILLSMICSVYYFTDKFVISSFVPRHNFLYCAPWILGGACVFLFRNEIRAFIAKYRWAWLGGCVIIDVVWHLVPSEISGIDICVLKNLALYLPWLMYAISIDSKILNNKAMKYLSGISLELYLAQMVIFRCIEKANCLYIFGNGWLSFLIVWIAVVVGLIIFIEVWKFIRTRIVRMVENGNKKAGIT